MFNKALIATDLSAASLEVIRSIGCLQNLGVRECILLQCLNIHEASYAVIPTILEFIEKDMLEAEKILQNLGFKVTREMSPGYAKTEINRLAVERGCDLIVVGSQGQSIVKEFLLGGVAEAVIHHAKLPVLLIPVKEIHEKTEPRPEVSIRDLLHHVLFPTDFSEFSNRAFDCLASLGGIGIHKVTLLHVQDRVRIEPHLVHRLEEFNRIDADRLVALQSKLSPRTSVDKKIVLGYPSNEILNEITSNDVSLVVMGSRGRGYMGEIFMGSVSHNIARRSTVPVLLVN